MSRPPAYEEAYPQKMWRYERDHLCARVPERALPDDRPGPAVVGIALSGGGIRSATFCLGVFQALARLEHLSRIDYVSTVSGGGYFGSFLGRLYRRREIRSAEDVRRMLDPAASAAERPADIPDVVASLRENGRYLSPNGAGDLLTNAAIMLRNWLTIHVVVLSFALLILMTGHLLRVALELWWPWTRWDQSHITAAWLWWSPWIAAPGITFLCGAIPAGWAFWMIGSWKRRSVIEWPVWGVVFTAVLAIGLVLAWRPLGRVGGPLALIAGGILVAIALTGSVWAWVCGKAASMDSGLTPEEAEALRQKRGSESLKVFAIDRQRNLLSMSLKSALVVTAALLAFALVDSIGQTLYLRLWAPNKSLTFVYSALTALAGVAAFANRIATALGGRANGGRLRLPVAALVTLGALAVAALLLISLSVLASAVAWRFQEPSGGPAIVGTSPPASRTAITVQLPDAAGGPVTATAVPGTPPLVRPVRTCSTAGAGPCVRDAGNLLVASLVWVILLGFGLLFGRSWPFINQSSLYSMYSARLTRAYLGASNPRRRHADKGDLTEVVPGDNIDPIDYWLPPVSGNGSVEPPLHLINVTINETVDGRSHVQSQDRKGTGLALGPCAFSVGIRHHAVFPSHAVFREADVPAQDRPDPQRRPAGATVFPKPRADAETPAYRVFGATDDGPGWRGGEPLSIGKWTGISGAAFSTGLGARTNLGLSLLCGLANVRLGYWWDSGVEPAARAVRRQLWWPERMFPVQSYLLSEFLSRFYGTSRKYWYLSDGGHFENMGGYELIRRRLERIVVIDAEADPDYTFEGLANLVRKARLDFGARIDFLSEAELDQAVPKSHQHLFGTLEQLRRGKWTQEPVKERLLDQLRLTVDEPIDEARHSLAHAALARVTFIDEPEREPGWLLYIKPTLMGDEPSDIVQYHRGHQAFPQETTADQFFDEAQWESYRMLGYHIAFDVLGPGVPGLASAKPHPPSPSALIFPG